MQNWRLEIFKAICNLGASGEGVFAQLNGAEMQFKKLIGGGNVTLSADGNAITINSVGGLQTLNVETDNGTQAVTDGDTEVNRWY